MSERLQHSDFISVENYLAGEDSSDIRHEYLAGRVYAMTGASVRHNRIAGHLFAALYPATQAKNCDLFMSDVKLRLNMSGDDVFYYPDLMVCCDEDDNHPYYRTQPCLIIEILSDSTERIDRREKRFAYTQIQSLQGYFLLAQDDMQATLYRRQANEWLVERYTEAEQFINLPCLESSISLKACYTML